MKPALKLSGTLNGWDAERRRPTFYGTWTGAQVGSGSEFLAGAESLV